MSKEGLTIVTNHFSDGITNYGVTNFSYTRLDKNGEPFDDSSIINSIDKGEIWSYTDKQGNNLTIKQTATSGASEEITANNLSMRGGKGHAASTYDGQTFADKVTGATSTGTGPAGNTICPGVDPKDVPNGIPPPDSKDPVDLPGTCIRAWGTDCKNLWFTNRWSDVCEILKIYLDLELC